MGIEKAKPQLDEANKLFFEINGKNKNKTQTKLCFCFGTFPIIEKGKCPRYQSIQNSIIIIVIIVII